jgi:catechol 2,3-dioxygenase-like lactoylglutathione lyase family enzyme
LEQRVSIITLGVKDFQRSLDFYKSGLGWKPSSASSENIAFFPMEGVVFALYPRDLLAGDATIGSSGSGFSGITLSHNTKRREQVDQVLNTVRDLGMQIIKPAKKTSWGGYHGYFADPDGYLWEVAWNPHFAFDEKDNLVLP